LFVAANFDAISTVFSGGDVDEGQSKSGYIFKVFLMFSDEDLSTLKLARRNQSESHPKIR